MLCINPIRYPIGLPEERAEQYDFFQEKERLFDLYYSEENFTTPTVTHSVNAPHLSGIYFNLGNQFDCYWPTTNKKVTFHGNHFTLVHLPQDYTGHCVMNGLHRSLLININPELLIYWSAEYLTLLTGLEDSLRNKTPYVFRSHPFFIEDQLVKTINMMMQSELTDPGREARIFSTCQMLMIASFDQLKYCCQRTPLEAAISGDIPSADKALLNDDNRELLSRTESFLLKKIRYKLTLDHIAYEIDTDPRLLTRLFQKHHGKTVMEWLFSERMKLAQHLLTTTTKSVRDVAMAVGYPLQTHFTKAFKRRWGYHPTIVRKNFTNRLVQITADAPDDDGKIHIA